MNKIIEIMDETFQNVDVKVDNIQIKYSDLGNLDKYILYVVKNMNGPLFTMISGLITSMSVNLLTNFVNIDLGIGFIRVVLSIMKLISCLTFNISFVCFTIIAMNINNEISIPSDIVPKDQTKYKLKQYLFQYSEHKSILKKHFVLSVLFGAITVLAIVLTPFIEYFVSVKPNQ